MFIFLLLNIFLGPGFYDTTVTKHPIVCIQ